MNFSSMSAGIAPMRRHQAQRDGQIVMAALLGQVGGREIDRDVLGGKRQPGGDQRAAHALAAFSHRLVGQAHDVEAGQAGRDLHLNIDRHRLDTLECDRGDLCGHAVPSHGV